MLTLEQKQAIKDALIQKCVDRGRAPYLLDKNADIASLGNNTNSWQDVKKGMLIALSFYDCRMVTEKDITLGGYFADQDMPMYLVKDIVNIEGETIIETVGGKILSTIDLEADWRAAMIHESLKKEEELMHNAMKEGSILSKFHVQAFCKEMEIQIPPEHKNELLEKIPSTIESVYQKKLESLGEHADKFTYDGFFRRELVQAIDQMIKNFEIDLKQEQLNLMCQYYMELPKPVIAIEGRSVGFSDKNGVVVPIELGVKKNQQLHFSGLAYDCKHPDDMRAVIGDETVVSCYNENGTYILETQNYVFTNIRELQDAICIRAQEQSIEAEVKDIESTSHDNDIERQ